MGRPKQSSVARVAFETALSLQAMHDDTSAYPLFAMAYADKTADRDLRGVYAANLAFAEGSRAQRGTPGAHRRAMELFAEALETRPAGWPEVLYNRANYLSYASSSAERDLDAAERDYREVLRLNPKFHQALHGLGNVMFVRGALADAIKLFRKAWKSHQHAAYAHSLSAALRMLRDASGIDESVTVLEEAIRSHPNDAETLARLANIYIAEEDGPKARELLKRALRVDPNHVFALGNLADSLRNDRMYRLAIPFYRRAVELGSYSANRHTFCNYVYALQFVSDWRDTAKNFARLVETLKMESQEPVTSSSTLCVHPFMSIAYPLPATVVKGLAERHARIAELSAEESGARPYAAYPRRRRGADDGPRGGRKLRIGYFGAEFGDEVVGRDFVHVLAAHDRDVVEVYVYALNGSDGSWYRETFERDADRFRDLSTTGNVEAARLIHEDEVDVLINLTGYTRKERTSILALRPAPVQIFFKGYMGPAGATYVDFTLSDRHTSPPEYAPYFTEGLAFMNDTFFVSDYAESAAKVLDDERYAEDDGSSADPAPLYKRRDYGLPDEGFVFSNFNQLYKIDPAIFQVWMRLLKRVPGSVLWLINKPSDGADNIKREAVQAGVDPARVIFLNMQPGSVHIQIKALADIFLDTPLYNGHSTGADALWGGVPVLTLPRVSMASRVGLSFVSTMGVPELAVRSLEEYEELAVQLANDPDRLREIRDRVKRARTESSLFDIKDWTRRAEASYQAMYEAKTAFSKHKRKGKRLNVF